MRYLIVDGHSVIFAWPELRAQHDRRSGAARDELVRRLTAYQDASGIRVVAVFDGKGVKPNEATEPGGIQIFYSRAGQSADLIIERLVAIYAKEHDITVVTDDGMERQTVLTFGALTMSTDIFRDVLADAGRDLSRRLRSHRRKP
jgi:predicted RNA-binding protein with PIN domain